MFFYCTVGLIDTDAGILCTGNILHPEWSNAININVVFVRQFLEPRVRNYNVLRGPASGRLRAR